MNQTNKVWLSLACLHVTHHSAGHLPLTQSHKHQVTYLSDWLVPGSAAAVLASSDLQCLTEELISDCRAAQQQETEILILLGLISLGFWGFFRTLRMKLPLEAILMGASCPSPLFVLTAESMACEFTQETFTLMQEVLVQADIY